jgi:hypothetical protein
MRRGHNSALSAHRNSSITPQPLTGRASELHAAAAERLDAATHAHPSTHWSVLVITIIHLIHPCGQSHGEHVSGASERIKGYTDGVSQMRRLAIIGRCARGRTGPPEQSAGQKRPGDDRKFPRFSRSPAYEARRLPRRPIIYVGRQESHTENRAVSVFIRCPSIGDAVAVPLSAPK